MISGKVHQFGKGQEMAAEETIVTDAEYVASAVAASAVDVCVAIAVAFDAEVGAVAAVGVAAAYEVENAAAAFVAGSAGAFDVDEVAAVAFVAIAGAAIVGCDAAGSASKDSLEKMVEWQPLVRPWSSLTEFPYWTACLVQWLPRSQSD